MDKKFIFTIALAAFGCTAFGQSKGKRARAKVVAPVEEIAEAVNSATIQVKTPAEAFADTLALYKAKLDSIYTANDSLVALQKKDVKYYRLFTPLTYDPSVVGNKIKGKNDDEDVTASEIETALINMYIQHPELVETTVSRLQASASKAETAPTAPVKRKVNIVKEEAQIEESIPTEEQAQLFTFKPNFWKFSGDYRLQFMQTHISDNWYQSGESNLSMLGDVVLQLNYDNKGKVKFENKLEMKLGFQTSESDSVHTLKASSDLLRYTTKFGLQATKNWYYTVQGIATTQFAYGLKTNNEKIFSDFFSPITVNLSVGMDYQANWLKGKLKGSFHIAPFAYNWKYVDRLNLATQHGIDEGHHSLQDYGSQITTNLTWQPMKDFKWSTRFFWYTTYKRTEIQWENTMTFAFSKYISANLYLHPRFDDSRKRADDESYFQFKEYLSIGFSYSM